jgi:hypothetical protein
MGQIHIVKDGEHLPGIAAMYGFSSYKSVWEHPENAELKKERKNPNILNPGDKVFIPDKEIKEETRPADAKHLFEADTELLVLRVKVLDLLDRPRGEPCTLSTDSANFSLFEVNDHILAGTISSDAEKGELFFPIADQSDVKIPVFIGGLNPIKEVTGQQQRLNNLGYFAGFDEHSTAQLKFAIEEFQCDHLKECKLTKPTGDMDDHTRDALEKAYGC